MHPVIAPGAASPGPRGPIIHDPLHIFPSNNFLTILCQILSIYLAFAVYMMINGELSHVSDSEAERVEGFALADPSEDIVIPIHS